MRIQSKLYQSRVSMRLLLVFLALAIVACLSIGCIASGPIGRAFPEAERLFHQDPRWLGGDGALSIRLSDNRILWLFGDTFIATSNAHVRTESKLVRNTVAIQTGKDPRIASVSFMWGQKTDGSPASFFPEHGERFYWPGHGIRLDKGPLVIFLYALVATPGRGLGFAPIGYAIAVIANPDQPLQAWKPRIEDAKANTFDAVPATAVIQANGYVVALAIRQQGTHAGALVRYPVAPWLEVMLRMPSGGQEMPGAGCLPPCSAKTDRQWCSTMRAASARFTGTRARNHSSMWRAMASAQQLLGCARPRPSLGHGARLLSYIVRLSLMARGRSCTLPRHTPSSSARSPRTSWLRTPRTASSLPIC